jgi:hypothetical protein
MHQKRYEELKDKELEEVFPPKYRRNLATIDKFTTNKCCYVTPSNVDFGQSTEGNAPTDKVILIKQ